MAELLPERYSGEPLTTDRVVVMKSFIITTDTNGLDILFTHTDAERQNPLLNAIEILAP